MARLGRSQPAQPKFIVAPQVGAVTVSVPTAKPAGVFRAVLQAGQRGLRSRLGRSQPFPVKFIVAPQKGAVGTTAAPAQTVQVQVVDQSVPRATARARYKTTAQFIKNPQPPLVVTGPAGQTIVVTQAIQRSRIRPKPSAKFITPPQVGAVGSAPSIPQATPVVPALLQSINRAWRSRLGWSQPLQPKFITSPQTAPFPGQPPGVVSTVLQAAQRALRGRRTGAQFIAAPQVGAVTPPTVTTGQPAGVYVRVVSEAVTRETQQRLGRGVPFPPKFIVPPQVGAAPPPPATVTTAGEGFNPVQRRRYVVRGAIEPEMIALLLEQGIITEEEAALMLAMS